MASYKERPNQLPIPDFPQELNSEHEFLRLEAFRAVFLLDCREKDIETGFSLVIKRADLIRKGVLDEGEQAYVDTLTRNLDSIDEKLRENNGWLRYNFAKAIHINGEPPHDEPIEKYPGYRYKDIQKAIRAGKTPERPKYIKVFTPFDKSQEPELEIRLEHFIDRYGGSEPANVKRRQRVLNHEEDIKIPSIEDVLALSAMRKKKSSEPGPEQDILFDTERLFSGEGHTVILTDPENFDDLALGAQQLLDGVDLLLMRNSSRSYYEHITDPARTNIEKLVIESKPKSPTRPSMAELERMAKEKITAALANKTARESGLFPEVVLEVKDIETAYEIWEEIYAATGNEEKEGLRQAALKITEAYKKEQARKQITENQ